MKNEPTTEFESDTYSIPSEIKREDYEKKLNWMRARGRGLEKACLWNSDISSRYQGCLLLLNGIIEGRIKLID